MKNAPQATDTNVLMLAKGGHVYAILYRDETAYQAMQQLARWACDDDLPAFTARDAGTLGKRLMDQQRAAKEA